MQTIKFLSCLGLVGALALAPAGCSSNEPEMPPPTELPIMKSNPPPAHGFFHEGAIDGIESLFNLAVLPAAESERLHSCGKIRFNTLSRMLTSRGVNVAAGNVNLLMMDAPQALGVATFSGRVPESDRNSTGSLNKIFDIMIAAAAQLVPDATTDRLGLSTACNGLSFFNGDGTCNAAGFSCFVGTPVSEVQLTRCSQLITAAAANTTPVNGRRLAVAAVASTYYMCD